MQLAHIVAPFHVRNVNVVRKRGTQLFFYGVFSVKNVSSRRVSSQRSTKTFDIPGSQPMVDDSQPVVDEKSSTTYCAIPCVRNIYTFPFTFMYCVCRQGCRVIMGDNVFIVMLHMLLVFWLHVLSSDGACKTSSLYLIISHSYGWTNCWIFEWYLTVWRRQRGI